jgi:hypothetical protein
LGNKSVAVNYFDTMPRIAGRDRLELTEASKSSELDRVASLLATERRFGMPPELALNASASLP